MNLRALFVCGDSFVKNESRYKNDSMEVKNETTARKNELTCLNENMAVFPPNLFR